jgi:hypothetical protein
VSVSVSVSVSVYVSVYVSVCFPLHLPSCCCFSGEVALFPLFLLDSNPSLFYLTPTPLGVYPLNR